jgi:hypothetical protein
MGGTTPMNKLEKIIGPPCAKCEVPATWVRVELVGKEPINVFRCDGCDKLSAETAVAKDMQLRA